MPFRSVFGHRGPIGLLSRSIAGGSLPPSLIFSGPEGVGKRLVAQAVAQALNCPNAKPVDSHLLIDACGECATCKRIARGVHGDVLTLVPVETGTIKIEQARDVIDRAMYRPFEGRRRVTIIDDADAMAAPAQNALLKTLEEPPSSSVFILVTPRPDALLCTVRSRCSQIRFGRLNAADVAAVLERDHKHTRREALEMAAASDGSVGRALNARADEFTGARRDAETLLRSNRVRADARVRVERAKGLI